MTMPDISGSTVVDDLAWVDLDEPIPCAGTLHHRCDGTATWRAYLPCCHDALHYCAYHHDLFAAPDIDHLPSGAEKSHPAHPVWSQL